MNPGERLGRYQLVDRLGAGAMGEVWAADDPELGRRVAIKVLRDELTAFSERLRREARAMAQLVHPGVVAVHDVGEAGGRVYVAMELVDGDNLRTWLATARPWRAAVAAFVDAGRGLAAAHAAGLVHRDFKPDNVFVARSGRVAVGDFGIARLGGAADGAASELATAPTSAEDDTVPGTPPPIGFLNTLTSADDLVGTPAYMAPEQHQGRGATAASDQFAFCVALWEAVYGRRPFLPDPGDGLAPVTSVGLAIVAGRVTPPPANVSIPGWLRRALRRGLDGDPERRHPSMAALVATLERGLARRRRAAIAGFGVAALASTALAAFALAGGRDVAGPRCSLAAAQVETAWNPAVRARVSAAFGASARPHAPATLGRVLDALDRRALALGAARVAACEATHVRGEQSPAALDRHMACLDRRVEELGAVAALLGADPAAEVIDRSLQAVDSLGDPAACAAAALTDVAPPPAAIAEQVAATRRSLAAASALYLTGKTQAAAAAVEPLVATARALAYPPLLAEVLAIHAETMRQLGDAAGGERALQDAAVAAAAAADDVRAADALISQLELLIDLGGKPDAALARLGPAEVAVARTADPSVREDFLVARAMIYVELARYEEARVDLEAALASGKARRGTRTFDRMRVTSRLADALFHLGRHADALVLEREALALTEQTVGVDHPVMAQVLNNLAFRLEAVGEYAEAQRHAERALSIWERTLGPGHPGTASTLNLLGVIAGDLGRHDDEAAYIERALAIREKELGPEHPRVAMLLSNLAIVRRRQGRFDDALALQVRALAIREKVLGPEHPSVAYTLTSQANVLSDLGRRDEALAAARRGLAIREKALGAEHELVGWSLGTIADVLKQLGRDREACAASARAVTVLEHANGAAHPDLPPFLGAHARCLLDGGRAAEALAIAERAVAIGDQSGRDPLLVAVARFVLARALWVTGGDRRRAVELAGTAHTLSAAGSPESRRGAPEMARWLASHRAP